MLSKTNDFLGSIETESDALYTTLSNKNDFLSVIESFTGSIESYFVSK